MLVCCDCSVRKYLLPWCASVAVMCLLVLVYFTCEVFPGHFPEV